MMKHLTSKSAEPIREKVIEMHEKGNPPTVEEVAKMKKDASGDKRPTPTDAKQQAMETGEVVIGSDDKFYTPLPPDEVEDYQSRRDKVYNTIHAIEEIAMQPEEPKEWLDQAEEHWLINLKIAEVKFAAKWLTRLGELLEK